MNIPYTVTIDPTTEQVVVHVNGRSFPVADDIGPVTAEYINYDGGLITKDTATVGEDGTVDIGFSHNFLWDEVAAAVVEAVKSL